MLDQMFTPENFRRIYDTENRKGFDVAGEFFPQLEEGTFAVKDKASEIRELRKNQAKIKPEDFSASLSKLKRELSELKAIKSQSVDAIMEDLSVIVSSPEFKIELTKKDGPNGKSIYTIDGSPETFFVIKQLQRNINRIYGVKQSSRHDLSCRLRDTLSGKFPFEIVRTDISSFYETLNRKRLLSKLDEDHLLSASSMRFIKQTLNSYGQLAASNDGIPRGVGISAYLAELYLRPVDKALKSLPGTILYGRYVDDIVIVFARPPAGKTLAPYQGMVTDVISNFGLAHNATKTEHINLGNPGIQNLNYLGYSYKISSVVEISPTAAKLSRMEDRLNAAFQTYDDESSVDSRKAFRDLVARVKFLTGNTRLSHSKSNARTGIFYNNSLVTDITGFTSLDSKMKKKIKAIKRPVLRKRLAEFSFEKGFIERRYYTFTALELKKIVRAWANG